MGFFRLGKGRNVAERSLAEAQAERDRLSGERDELLAALQREQRRSQAAERRATDAEARATAAEEQVKELESTLATLSTTTASTTAAARPAPTAASGSPASGGSVTLRACWPLVLGHLERRWATGLGATPGSRGIPEGPVADQIGESLGREVDRLREEVGVDVSFAVGEVVEPANPVVFLLAATDLLGAMASRCERVVVRLDRELVVAGEVWTDLGDEIDSSRARALTAGATIDPIDVGRERVVVTLRP